MARRSNSRRRRVTYRQARRGASVTAKPPRGLHSVSLTKSKPLGYLDPGRVPSLNLSHYEDNRQWKPATLFRSSRRIGGAPARLAAPTSLPPSAFNFYSPPSIVAFREPRRVVVCIRRAIRRQVLHAFSIAGRGGLARPRRTASSSISCKG